MGGESRIGCLGKEKEEEENHMGAESCKRLCKGVRNHVHPTFWEAA